MNTKDFLRLGVPLGEATRRATDFVSKFMLLRKEAANLHAKRLALTRLGQAKPLSLPACSGFNMAR